jgi:hypothetical protein
MTAVYHFTDTARMPRIIETGELRPSNNFVGNFPQDFLWATTNSAGDRTSSAQSQQDAYRKGFVQIIRLTLKGEAFDDWHSVLAKFPAWTDQHINSLLAVARRQGETGSNWRARVDPLPLSEVTAVHAKSYKTGQWMPIPATSDFCVRFDGEPMVRGFVVGDRAYCAKRYQAPSGATGYGDLWFVDVEGNLSAPEAVR